MAAGIEFMVFHFAFYIFGFIFCSPSSMFKLMPMGSECLTSGLAV